MPATLHRSGFAQYRFRSIRQGTPDFYQYISQRPASDRSPWRHDAGWQLRGDFLQAATPPVQKLGSRRRKVAAWQRVSSNLLGRLQQLQLLPQGWDGDDAPQIAPEAIALAEHFLETLASAYLNFREPIIVPKYDGLLQLEWHDEARTLELEALPTGWSVMGAIRHGGAMTYSMHKIGRDDFASLEEAYRWWTDRAQAWPFQ